MHLSYDDHGYADDISITTYTLHNLQIQLRKLHLFSQYTGLELEISKCEATGALWGSGNPMSKASLSLLETQIKTIQFIDGTPIKFLPPHKTYKMLGVHINPLLDFREHHNNITTEVKALIKVLGNRRISPNRKKLVIDQLLKSKYHATHLGIFTTSQLMAIDKLLNKAARNSLGLLSSFPT